jgi:hypothetical protein
MKKKSKYAGLAQEEDGFGSAYIIIGRLCSGW